MDGPRRARLGGKPVMLQASCPKAVERLEQLAAFELHAYLVLCLAHVVPRPSSSASSAHTLHRLALSERGAKVLKRVSDVLLVVAYGSYPSVSRRSYSKS